MSAYALIVEPFATLAFMRAALVACMALALANGAVGTLLVLRRMSLDGDVLGHAVMPGAAVGFLYAGPSPTWLSLGGLASGLAVAGQQCRRHARAVRHCAGDRPAGPPEDRRYQQRDRAGDRGIVSTTGSGCVRSVVSSRGGYARAVRSGVSGGGSVGAGGELPGVRHTLGGGTDAAAGRGGAVLGAGGGSVDGAGDGLR